MARATKESGKMGKWKEMELYNLKMALLLPVNSKLILNME